jgi:hypothetical protein
MMRCDAEWLHKTLAQLDTNQLSPLLNLGSSTREFREVKQPFVHELVFKPLEGRGVKVIHSDIKEGEGVDIACDIFDDAGLARIRALNPKAVLCTHMFEHVTDHNQLAKRILDMLPSGGLFIITVPYSYHYHADPIDTMFRPSPDELAALFPGQEILTREVLIGDTYWSHVKKRPLTLFFRHFFRFFLPFLGMDKWKRSMRKLYWLAHPYKVSAIIGRKQ